MCFSYRRRKNERIARLFCREHVAVQKTRRGMIPRRVSFPLIRTGWRRNRSQRRNLSLRSYPRPRRHRKSRRRLSWRYRQHTYLRHWLYPRYNHIHRQPRRSVCRLLIKASKKAQNIHPIVTASEKCPKHPSCCHSNTPKNPKHPSCRHGN